MHCLEYLVVPSKIGEELGLGNKVDMLKIEKLRSMKELKCLGIGEIDDIPNYNEMLAKEMPQLIRYSDTDLMALTRGHKQVEFLSPPIQE